MHALKRLPVFRQWKFYKKLVLQKEVAVFYQHRAIDSEDFPTLTPAADKYLKSKDRIPKDYELIYNGKNMNYFQYGLYFGIVSWICCIGGLFYIYIMYINVHQDLQEFPYEDEDLEVLSEAAEMRRKQALGILLLMFMNFLLISVSRQFVLRIYIHPKEKLYKAAYVRILPWRPNIFTFRAGSVDINYQHPLKFLRDVVFSINGRKAVLFDYHFRTFKDFTDMLKQVK